MVSTLNYISLLSLVNTAFAQEGIGAKYNARDPRTCADKASPKTGAPSAAKAAEFVVCKFAVIFDFSKGFSPELENFPVEDVTKDFISYYNHMNP